MPPAKSLNGSLSKYLIKYTCLSFNFLVGKSVCMVEVTSVKEGGTVSFFFIDVFITVCSYLAWAVCVAVRNCVLQCAAVCGWAQQWLCHSDNEPHNPQTELNTVHLYQH